MDFILHPAETRVLGSLLEKDITTPEYYPLTLNALVNACNQKTNREPIVHYDEETVLRSLDSLKAKGFITTVSGSGSRAVKYAHRFQDRLNLGRRELAIVCELMLRGPQTLGELRGRASRMHDFSDLDEVESCLRGLMERQPDSLAARLPHQPGTKEARYAHLLSGQPLADVPSDTPMHSSPYASPSSDRVSKLEAEMQALREEIESIKRQFQEFRKQFE